MNEGVDEALQSLVDMACERSLATNSLMLRFDFRERSKGRAYLWINPPWRLTLDGQFVTGSADWPVWDGVEEPEVNRPLWEAWCALFNPLNDTTLTEVIMGSPLPDLQLQFASGYGIDVFGHVGDDYWWYYRDRITGEVFEAKSKGIAHEITEPAED